MRTYSERCRLASCLLTASRWPALAKHGRPVLALREPRVGAPGLHIAKQSRFRRAGVAFLRVGARRIFSEARDPLMTNDRKVRRDTKVQTASRSSLDPIKDVADQVCRWRGSIRHHRQSVRHEIVTHVLGTFRHPCLRAGHALAGWGGRISNSRFQRSRLSSVA